MLVQTQYLGANAEVKNSLVTDGCAIYGKVENSVIFQNVYIGKNTVVKNSVIMPNAKLEIILQLIRLL